MNELLKNITSVLYLDGSPVGTGFFIDKNHVITCKHCLGDSFNKIEFKISNGNLISAELFKESELNNNKNIDIAILKIKNEFHLEREFIPISSNLNEEDKVYTYGLNLDRKKNVSSIEEKILTYNGEAVIDGKHYLRLVNDKLKHGNSGSPILNMRTGFICGIITSTEDEIYPQGGYGMDLSCLCNDNYYLKIKRNLIDEKYYKWRSHNRILKNGIGYYDKTYTENHFSCLDMPYDINVLDIFIEPNYSINNTFNNSLSNVYECENFVTDIMSILEKQKVLFMEGAYGCGKTILSKKIQLEYIEKDYDTIYINCSDLEFSLKPIEFQTKFKERILNNFNTLVILDGFDELNFLSKEKKETIPMILNNILWLKDFNKNICILINTREIGKKNSVDIIADIFESFYEKIRDDIGENPLVIKIGYFENNQIDCFLNNWNEINNGKINVGLNSQKLRNVKTLKAACCNPLLLMWINIAAQEKGWEEVKNFYSIYESFIDNTIKGKFKSTHGGIKEIRKEYKLFLQSIAKEIAYYHKNKLFKRRKIYDFNIAEEDVYAVETPTLNINSIIEKIIDKKTLDDISEDKLKENLLMCYFLDFKDKKWRFKDNNIVYFLLSEILMSELTLFVQKYNRYVKEENSNIYKLVYDDYTQFKSAIAPINQISLDYILVKLKKEESIDLKIAVFDLIQYLFSNKVLFNIDEKWLSEFDERRMNADILLSLIFVQIINSDYEKYELGYFFKRLSWIISAAKRININYYYLIKRFYNNTIIKNVELRRINLTEFNFKNSKLDYVKFIQCKLFQTIFENVKCEGECEFFLCDFNKPIMRNNSGKYIFNNCNFSSISIKNPQKATFIFNNCRIDHIEFNGDIDNDVNIEFLRTNAGEVNIQLDKVIKLDIIKSQIEKINLKSGIAKNTFIIDSHIECSSKVKDVIDNNAKKITRSSIDAVKGDKYK